MSRRDDRAIVHLSSPASPSEARGAAVFARPWVRYLALFVLAGCCPA